MMGTITLVFAIISGVLTTAKDVIGIDVSLHQNTPGKVPLAAAFAPPAPPVLVAPAAPMPLDLAHAPIRTMAPIWSLGDGPR